MPFFILPAVSLCMTFLLGSLMSLRLSSRRFSASVGCLFDVNFPLVLMSSYCLFHLHMYPTAFITEMKTSMRWISLPMIMMFEPCLVSPFPSATGVRIAPRTNSKAIRLLPKPESDVIISALLSSHFDDVLSLQCCLLRAFHGLLHYRSDGLRLCFRTKKSSGLIG